MNFIAQPETIFGNPSCPATEVDTATILWDYDPLDGIKWVVAVGIEDPPDPSPPSPIDPSYPVVRFLGRDTYGDPVLGDTFTVTVYPVSSGRDCRLPKVDCRWVYDSQTQETYQEVVVVYRYSKPGYTWSIIENQWDIRVTKLRFSYDVEEEDPEDKWTLISQVQMPVSGGENQYTGQTHPDIVYEQCSGDIYCAWSDLEEENSDLLYNRYNDSTASWVSQTGWSLEYTDKANDPWFVSIDTGLVEGTNPEEPEEVHRIVAFAYTGRFFDDPLPAPNLWGFRPVVGWWYIDNCTPDDDDHPALTPLYNPAFPPNNPAYDNRKFNAGMARIDIPWDSTEPHNASMVYIQDTELGDPGYYEVYGISSLAPTRFRWLSVPSTLPPEFIAATLPSLAVNGTDGANVSVSFFASGTEPASDWQAWATLWNASTGTVSAPTEISVDAEGESNFDESFITHDWGTASSIVMMDEDSDFYWAAWSDKFGAYEPSRVLGSLGFANP